MNTPEFPLVRTVKAPVAVTESRRTLRPHALVHGRSATMLGGASPCYAIVDFGTLIVGEVRWRISADAAATVCLSYGENADEARRTEPYAADWFTLPKDRFALEAGEHDVVAEGRRAFRFATLRLESGDPCEVLSVVATDEHYPAEMRGHFSCSDARLNDIWGLSSRTTLACMQQFYEDGVKRDGMLWVGDYRTQFRCAWHGFGDAELARKSLRIIAASQREDGAVPAAAVAGGGHQHPDRIAYMPGMPGALATWVIANYNADYLIAARDYALYTGNESLLAELWPSMKRCLRFIEADVDPFAATPTANAVITDTDAERTGGWWASYGTFLHQLFEASDVMESLARQLGDPETADAAGSFKRKLALALDGDYYDSALGLYRDRSEGEPTFSRQAQAFAALSGRAGEPADSAALLERAAKLPGIRYPVLGFMEGHWLEALLRAGMTETALAEMRRYYGFMLDQGAVTCWELSDPERWEPYRSCGHPFSDCHGWSASPQFLLPAYVTGVRPLGPGYSEAVITPSLGDLEWAECAVPTPRGELYASFERDGQAIVGKVFVPAGIRAYLGRREKAFGEPLAEGWNEVRIEGI